MFNTILSASLKYRVIVLILSMILIILGTQQIHLLQVDVLPDLNKPTVTVIIDAGGLPPEDIERRINVPIEQSLNGINGLNRIRSVANLGLGVIYTEFDWGTDLYQIRQQMTEKLSVIKNQLPAGISPQMLPTSSIMGEIMLIAIHAKNDEITPMQLREFADYTIRPQLLGVKGVAQVMNIGGEIMQIHVIPDLQNMENLKISLSDFRNSLRNFSQNTSGNVFEFENQEYILRHLPNHHKNDKNSYQNYINDLNQQVIKDNILLSQVAKVELKSKFKRGDAGFNGQPAVILAIQKQMNTDTLNITKNIETLIRQINLQNHQNIAPIQIVFRQADFIQHSIDNLLEALRDGAIIVAIILLLFTMSGRITLISLIAIPLSVLISILIFRWFNLSINTMTLGGLAIAMGELVDDAVIDIENINRRLRLAQDKIKSNFDILEIIRLASLEVRTGVVYATFIVILVCFPLLALNGLEGQLFKPLIFAYIVSILASLLVAVVLTPVLAYYFMGKLALNHKQKESKISHWIQYRYKILLNTLLNYKKIILSTISLIILSILISAIFLPKSFLPLFNEGTLTINLFAQPSMTLKEVNRIAQEAEFRLLEINEIKHVARRTGRAELDEHGEGIHYSELDVSFVDEKRPSISEIQKKLADLPINISIGQPISHRIDHLLSGVRSQIAIKIFGSDLNISRNIAENIIKQVDTHYFQNINIEKLTLVPEIQVKINPIKAQQANLNPAEIAEILRIFHQGEIVSNILISNSNQNIDVLLKGENFDQNMLIPTPKGLIPLNQLADIDIVKTRNQINRENLERRLIINATAQENQLETVIYQLNQVINQQKIPSGYRIVIDGQYQAQQTASQQLMILVIISMILISFIIFHRFKNWSITLLILINIPLAFSGGILALWISNKNLDIAGMIGFITLAGIATRSSLLKISAYLQLKNDFESHDALIQACSERLIPVLMTTLSAMLALIPLILEPHQAGKEILNPVATVIFGGLISNLILDSIITPILLKLWGKS